MWNHSNKTAQNAVLQTFCHRALDKRDYLMIIFLISIETIRCDPSSEPFCQDGSDEG